MLDKISIVDIHDALESMLKNKFRFACEASYSVKILHLYEENALADNHDEDMIDKLNALLLIVKAIDKFPDVFFPDIFGFVKSMNKLVTCMPRLPMGK